MLSPQLGSWRCFVRDWRLRFILKSGCLGCSLSLERRLYQVKDPKQWTKNVKLFCIRGLEEAQQLKAQPGIPLALENLRVYLCEKIIAERHFDHLRAKKILSREDTEEISCRTSSRKRAGKLLDYLQENPKGLDTLVESIRREKTQNFLIQKITDEVLKLRNIKLEHLKDGATNNLSRSNSDESNFSEKLRASTVMYHPEGESSTTPFFSTNSSLNLPVLEVGRTENTIFSSTTLPRPGDPGAPPLPPDLQLEEEGTCANSSEMFLPLRSRTVSRQ
ncbi:B-cell lymphoma/leukemia 10 isoform X2 [Homo sapiens]|uniref:B-cell lymphoma/leukemia 10 isoform X2 n=1 Tax=Homo sapiens TaxID=9606 RepID=UPI0005D04077|nr:B-cell lymphoma/leukemia 10 isoform X2 [Homo sapiens]XP_054195443.1 B-cell lymphoma/leukemia 10 isoform X2 [Homo sapiens]|eukprot:XP_011540700.1 B-cell lymphoma/leukemia 10 isoform X2 [Homo sapiens]